VLDFELGVLHPVQQHVPAGEIIGGDVFLLAVDFPIVPPCFFNCGRTFRGNDPEPQAKSKRLPRCFTGPVFGFLAVEGGDA
jgi:hypothetical protein